MIHKPTCCDKEEPSFEDIGRRVVNPLAIWMFEQYLVKGPGDWEHGQGLLHAMMVLGYEPYHCPAKEPLRSHYIKSDPPPKGVCVAEGLYRARDLDDGDNLVTLYKVK